ncbi:MAG: type 4a pilus biogenesis protein PilO [Candidatus Hydrogenedentota bacterium]
MLNLGWDKIPKKHKTIYISLLIAGSIYIYYLYFLSPLWLDIQNKIQTINQKQEELNKAETIANKEAIIKGQLDNLKKELEIAKQVLPTEKEIEVILENLSKLAQNFGIKMNVFTPTQEGNKGEYMEVPIHIEGTGGFPSLGLFLSEITKLERLVKVINIKIVSKLEKKSSISFTLDLSTYRVSR